MTPYQFTPEASQNNAFCWRTGTSSVFSTGKEIGIQARRQGQLTAKGRQIIDSAAQMRDKVVNQPAYTRAKPKGPGAHHKGARKAKP